MTYTNTGDAPVTLTWRSTRPRPGRYVQASADQVTVPAHGTAGVTVTAALDMLPADQPVSAMITGTDGTGVFRARTLIGAGREGQRQT